MMRRWLVLCACAAALSGVPAARAEIQAGAAMRVITPEKYLPVSGGMGVPKPSQEKRGELTARALVLRKGDVSVAVVGLDLLGLPVGAGRSRAGEGAADPGGEHPHRLDPHPQRTRLLRLPRRPGRPHRRPGVHGLRLRQGRRGDQRGDRPAPAGLDQGRHRRGAGEDRLQLLRARPLRPADERHPGRYAPRGRRSPRWSITRSIPRCWATASGSSARTWSVPSASGSSRRPGAWPCS